jgi:heat shock protein HtpX
MVMFSSHLGGEDDEQPSPLAILAASLLAPVAAGLIQLAVSRSREFEADRSAAELLGSGRSLVTAIERIELLAVTRPMPVTPAQAQAYSHNLLAETRSASGRRMAQLFATHPANAERVRRLRNID